MLRLDLDRWAIDPFAERIGGLDGIARDGASVLASDTFVGLYRIGADGATELLIEAEMVGLAGCADFGFDPGRRVIAVPELFGTEVTFLALP